MTLDLDHWGQLAQDFLNDYQVPWYAFRWSRDPEEQIRHATSRATRDLQDRLIALGLPDLSEDDDNALNEVLEPLVDETVALAWAAVLDYEETERSIRYHALHHTGKD